MLLRIHPDNPDERSIGKVVECLRNGGIVVYPTDTVYGLGCDINDQHAIERIARFKGLNLKKADLSFVCYDLSHISDFVRPMSNEIFKMMKKNLPGPFTFILDANSNVPKLFKNNKRTVGIRVPDNNIAREIVSQLGHPILSTSVKAPDDDMLEYMTDPELIEETHSDIADIVIDGGYGGHQASTVVDCTGGGIEIVREGKGRLVF